MKSQVDDQTIPGALELWIHERHGPVVVVREWNATESVCVVVESNRNAILQNCFLLGRVESEDNGSEMVPLRIHCRDGRVIELDSEGNPKA